MHLLPILMHLGCIPKRITLPLLSRRNLAQKWQVFPSTFWTLKAKKWNLLPLFGNQQPKSGIFFHFLDGTSRPLLSKISPKKWNLLPLFGNQQPKSGIFFHFLAGTSRPLLSKIRKVIPYTSWSYIRVDKTFLKLQTIKRQRPYRTSKGHRRGLSAKVFY